MVWVVGEWLLSGDCRPGSLVRRLEASDRATGLRSGRTFSSGDWGLATLILLFGLVKPEDVESDLHGWDQGRGPFRLRAGLGLFHPPPPDRRLFPREARKPLQLLGHAAALLDVAYPVGSFG